MRIRAEVLLAAAACVVGIAIVLSVPGLSVPGLSVPGSDASAQTDPDCASGQPASHSCSHGYCPSGEVVSAGGDCGADDNVYSQQQPAPPPLVGVM